VDRTWLELMILAVRYIREEKKILTIWEHSDAGMGNFICTVSRSGMPPHFYAHGQNPIYRHFGCIMLYMNRVCELISDGYHTAQVAVIYHAEGEGTGRAMYSQTVGHLLCDNQIEYDYLPQDVFDEEERYHARVMDKKIKDQHAGIQCCISPNDTIYNGNLHTGYRNADGSWSTCIFYRSISGKNLY
jgi:hypothetical protein